MDAGKWTCFILLIVGFKGTSSNAWRTSKQGNRLWVYGVTLDKESDPAHLNYSNLDLVSLQELKIDTFTTEMQSQITNVRWLELKNGMVPTVHVAPHFKEFTVWNCSTSNVIINPNITYKTELFGITYNKLEMVPKHLNVMKNLRYVFLHDNQIEFVDMADFTGLKHLEKIHLSRNRILEISSNPVVLPSLSIFVVEDNRLSSINFEHWNATSLKYLFLGRNRLSILLGFPIKFPGLKVVELNENPFNCQWLNATLKELKSRKVAIWSENLITCSKEEETLDEFRKIKFQKTFATRQELESTNSKLGQSIDNLTHNVKQSQKLQQQTISDLKKSDQEKQKEIDDLKLFQHNALDEIVQLKHKIDDLTESLYLHELDVAKDSP